MEQRLIDADALNMYERLKSYYGDAWRDAQEEIDSAPTIDAVPVIRCKDCKYSVDEYHDGECYCDYTKCLQYIKDWNHYCSWAKRREE